MTRLVTVFLLSRSSFGIGYVSVSVLRVMLGTQSQTKKKTV